LALQANLRANALYPLIPARRKIGFDRRRGKDGHGWFIHETIPAAREHFVDAYLAFARALGIDPGVPEWNLPVASDDAAHAQSLVAGLPRPLIAVQLAASKVERGWPMDRYAELIRKVATRWSAGFVLTGGPSATERALADQLVHQLANQVPLVNAVGRTAVPQLLALLSAVDLVIAPDTGPVHFATAFGTPVVGLYAVAPAQLSGPYFSRNLTVDKFDEAAQRFLGRTAQELPWNRRVHHPDAMKLIQVEDVLAKVDSALTASKKGAGKNTLARAGVSS
jgi:heptosyltransferase I